MLALLGAQLGGQVWMLGGFMATLLFALLLNGISETRAPATVAIGATVLGAAWIGLGLSFAILMRDLPEDARLATFTVLLSVFAADTVRVSSAGGSSGGTSSRPPCRRARRGRGSSSGPRQPCSSRSSRSTRIGTPTSRSRQALALGAVVALAAAAGDLFESALKRDMQIKDTGRLLGGHGGMLDRIDSLLFAIPAGYFLILAFTQ